jgi:hypothetical protein
MIISHFQKKKQHDSNKKRYELPPNLSHSGFIGVKCVPIGTLELLESFKRGFLVLLKLNLKRFKI